MADPGPDRRPLVPYDERSMLERGGIAHVKRLSRSLPDPSDDDPVFLLDPGERKKLVRIERMTVLRAALVGAISALVAAAGVWWADERFAVDPESPTLAQHAAYWGVVLGVAGVAAVFEMIFLYRDALRSTLMMARAAGLPLFDEIDDNVDLELAGALVRAALELPNPAEARLGIDPLREASRWQLLVYSALYKGKIAVTKSWSWSWSLAIASSGSPIAPSWRSSKLSARGRQHGHVGDATPARSYQADARLWPLFRRRRRRVVFGQDQDQDQDQDQEARRNGRTYASHTATGGGIPIQ